MKNQLKVYVSTCFDSMLRIEVRLHALRVYRFLVELCMALGSTIMVETHYEKTSNGECVVKKDLEMHKMAFKGITKLKELC